MTLVVTTPATDRSLLTRAELRDAVGVVDGSSDAKLIVLGDRVSALIARACNIASSGVVPPTLRVETVTETFYSRCGLDTVRLSRSPVISFGSVTEGGTVLSAGDYQDDAGSLVRLSSGVTSSWAAGLVSVVYDAGWATIPDDLKMAAAKFVQAEWQRGDRDPTLMSKRIEGVSEYRWWVDPTKDSAIPADVLDILRRGNYLRFWV